MEKNEEKIIKTDGQEMNIIESEKQNESESEYEIDEVKSENTEDLIQELKSASLLKEYESECS